MMSIASDARTARVLIAGDTHGNATWVEFLFNCAVESRCDAFIQLGDFGYWPHQRDGQRFLRRVEFLSHRAGIPLVWIDGNHENHELLRQLPARSDGFVELSPNVSYAPRGHRWTWACTTFGALGGAFSIDWRSRVRGVSWWPEEIVTERDIARLGTAPLDLLFTHDAPAGVPLTGLDLSAADELRAYDNRRHVAVAIENTNPRMVLHGHWHYRYGYTLSHVDRRATESTRGTVWRDVRVEGIASDQEGDGGSWGVLDLPSLTFQDGDAIYKALRS